MLQDYTIRKAADTDRDAVVKVVNYFITNSFANYMEQGVDGSFFDMARHFCRNGIFYVAETAGKGVVGFGMLRAHMYPGLFPCTAETSYFIMPDSTRKGLGSELLSVLEHDARSTGIESLLANISSLNEQSLAFHRKHGFKECGRFERIGIKFSRSFDVVWMQKFLTE